MQRHILNGTHSPIFRLNHIEFLYTLHQQQTAAYKLKLRKHIRRGMVCKTCSFLKLIFANLFRRKGKHHKTNKKVPSALMLLHPNYSFSFPWNLWKDTNANILYQKSNTFEEKWKHTITMWLKIWMKMCTISNIVLKKRFFWKMFYRKIKKKRRYIRGLARACFWESPQNLNDSQYLINIRIYPVRQFFFGTDIIFMSLFSWFYICVTRLLVEVEKLCFCSKKPQYLWADWIMKSLWLKTSKW